MPLIGSLNDGGVLSVTSKSSSSKSCTLPSLTSTKRELIFLMNWFERVDLSTIDN